MIWLFANWRWLLPTGAAVALGIMLGLSRIELASANLEIAHLNQAAAEREAAGQKALAAANAHSAALDAANAKLAMDLEQAHGKAVKDIANSGFAFDKRLRDAIARAAGRCQLSASPPAPGEPAHAPDGSNNGPGQPDFESGQRLREVGKLLQIDVQECWAWAKTHGR